MSISYSWPSFAKYCLQMTTHGLSVWSRKCIIFQLVSCCFESDEAGQALIDYMHYLEHLRKQVAFLTQTKVILTITHLFVPCCCFYCRHLRFVIIISPKWATKVIRFFIFAPIFQQSATSLALYIFQFFNSQCSVVSIASSSHKESATTLTSASLGLLQQYWRTRNILSSTIISVLAPALAVQLDMAGWQGNIGYFYFSLCFQNSHRFLDVL